jgi:hypothetical protein
MRKSESWRAVRESMKAFASLEMVGGGEGGASVSDVGVSMAKSGSRPRCRSKRDVRRWALRRLDAVLDMGVMG